MDWVMATPGEAERSLAADLAATYQANISFNWRIREDRHGFAYRTEAVQISD